MFSIKSRSSRQTSETRPGEMFFDLILLRSYKLSLDLKIISMLFMINLLSQTNQVSKFEMHFGSTIGVLTSLNGDGFEEAYRMIRMRVLLTLFRTLDATELPFQVCPHHIFINQFLRIAATKHETTKNAYVALPSHSRKQNQKCFLMFASMADKNCFEVYKCLVIFPKR